MLSLRCAVLLFFVDITLILPLVLWMRNEIATRSMNVATNRGTLATMSREEKATRTTGRARPALPPTSTPYILARADAYDATRADEKSTAWADRVDGACLHGS